jgi:hypothetical protein
MPTFPLSPPVLLSVTLLVSAASLVMLPPTAQAVGVVTHTYDEFIGSGNGNHVGTFYPGFTYSGTDEVTCNYNSVDYPYTTSPCVVLPTSAGSFLITANDASTAFTQYEAGIASGGMSVLFTGYDVAGNPVATVSCSSAIEAYTHCTLAAPTAMQKVRITGLAGDYIVDTSVFTIGLLVVPVQAASVSESVPPLSTPSSTPAVSACDSTNTVCVTQPLVPLPGPFSTPGIAVSASTTNILLAYGVGQFQTILPTPLGPVTICPTPPSIVCQSEPVVPGPGTLTGSATITLTAGSMTVQETIPLP